MFKEAICKECQPYIESLIEEYKRKIDDIKTGMDSLNTYGCSPNPDLEEARIDTYEDVIRDLEEGLLSFQNNLEKRRK